MLIVPMPGKPLSACAKSACAEMLPKHWRLKLLEQGKGI